MKAETLFRKFKNAAGEAVYTPMVEARPVKEGDSLVINAGVNIMTSADEDGWQVYIEGKGLFLNNEVFAKEIEKIDPATLNIVKQDLPADAQPKAVKKGQPIVVQPFSDTSVAVRTTAEQAGYLVTLEGKRKYFSDIEFRTTFNTNAAPLDDSQALYRAKLDPDTKPVKFLVLAEDTTLDFKAGAYTAPAGFVVYENEKDEDGYTAAPARSFYNNFTVLKPAR